MRAMLVRSGLTLLLVGVAAAACGSDESRRAYADDAGGPDPEGDAASPYGDGGAVFDVCEPTRLRELGSMAGCRYHLTASTWNKDEGSIGDGCWALAVSNPGTGPARLRLRFKRRDETKAREEDGAPYARRPVFDGRRVTYEPLEGGVLAPRQTAIVSAIYIASVDPGELVGTSLCPTKAFVEHNEAAARDERITPSIELVSDAPVLASQIARYHLDATSSSETLPIGYANSHHHLLFPVHLWEAQAVETGIYKPGLPATLPTVDSPHPTEPGRTFVIAAFDDTRVSLPTLEGAPRGVTLQRGEVFSHTTKDALAGRAASADKPVALVSFAPMPTIDWHYQAPFIPGTDIAPCYSMAMPSSLWGSSYVAARHGNRWEELEEAPAWRVLGGADGTVLTYEPYRPDGAPESIGRGELAVFFADAPFVIRSQDAAHAFYFSQSMTDAIYQLDRYGLVGPEAEDWRGGAFTVHQMAVERWSKRYPVFAPHDFYDHSLVLVRRRGGADVRLDCAGVVDGWQAVGADFEFARVKLTDLYEEVLYEAGACQAGPHWIESDEPFSGTLWGWGGSESSTLHRGSSTVYAVPLVGADVLPSPPSTK
ncbi:MAG: IgGFc-binding protein [Labilithrix sp.]|nr:IgGFc-binding protein [Labilithrix sp.]